LGSLSPKNKLNRFVNVKLFEEKTRIRLDPARHNEDPFEYYDSSAQKDISNIRKLLNEWFEKYPDSEKPELKSRFVGDFYPSFFELFLYELFYRLEFQIVIHPEIKNSNKKPDFLLRKNNLQIYVEAKEASDKSTNEEKIQNREGYFYDSLNKVISPNFFLQVKKLDIKTHEQPSIKSINRKVEDWLSDLDPDIIGGKMKERDFDSIPLFRINNDKILIEIKPLPKSKKNRGKTDGRPIGMYPIKSYWGGSENSIRRAIERKINKYGELTKPYLICINSTSFRGIDEEDILNAIFGKQVLSHNFTNNKSSVRREPNGLVYRNNRARNKKASAFFITNVLPHNLHIAKYWIYKHPFAKYDFDLAETNLTYHFIENNEIQKRMGKEISEILTLNEDWLDE
jgi:hypothetical protein